MTSDTTHLTRRHTLYATFAAVAFLGAFGVAQAQSSQQGTAMDSRTQSGSSPSMTAQSGTSDTGSPTQVNPDSRDLNREASQGMVPSTGDDSARARINAPDSDLRNDRTPLARAPRADRN